MAKMFLRHESVLALVKSLNGDDAGSKRLGIFHFHDIGLYTVTIEELSILIRAKTSFVKNANGPAPFHTTTFYISTRTFFGS